jgi:hypothetical protein
MANVSDALIETVKPPSPGSNWLEKLSDRISPIVIKEVRQMVRAREFNYSFFISIVLGLVIAFVAAINNSGKSDVGAGVFTALIVCLVLAGMVVSPMGAFNTLRNERVERTLDLVTITNLSPRRIVIGKLAAQAVKLTVLFAALAPFVAMSFLLGGIDFVTIALSLASLFQWSLWVCAAALFLSCLSKSRAFSWLIFVAMILLFLLFLSNGASRLLTLLIRPSSARYYGASTGPISTGPDLWKVLAWATGLCIISGINLILLAENRLLLPTENRSTALRVGFLVQYFYIIALCIYPRFARTGSVSGTADGLIIFAGLHLAVIALFSVTEGIGLSRRVLQQIRTGPVWRRLWFFRPGGCGGAAYVITLVILLLAAGATFIPTNSEDFSFLAATCGYACFFTGIPTLLVRKLEMKQIGTVQLRIGIILLVLTAVVLPDLLMYLATGRYGGDYSTRHVLNPFRTLYEWRSKATEDFHALSSVFCVAGFISYLLLIIEWRQMSYDTKN